MSPRPLPFGFGGPSPRSRWIAPCLVPGATLIFFVPLFGMAVGAAFGALSGAMGDVGIDDGFIKRVRDEVKPGSSALFLLSAGAVPDRLAEEVRNRGLNFKLVSSNLSQEHEGKLREIFGAE